MSFVSVNTSILHLLTEEVKLKFAKSNQPRRFKNIARDIFPIYHMLWQPRASYRARTWAVNIKYSGPEKRDWGLSKRIQPYTRIGFDDYFMCVDFNLSGAKRTTRRALKNLVSHEFAHMIETVFNKEINEDGNYTVAYDSETGHGPLWQELHRAMGGNASTSAGF
jgi:hypothetical protein